MFAQEMKHWRNWAGAAGGVILAASILTGVFLGYTGDSPVGALVNGVYEVALLLVLAGLWGVRARVGGRVATVGLGGAALGGALAVIGLTGLAVDTLRQTESGRWWDAFIVGLLGLLLGTATVMLAGLVGRALPRLGAGLVLAGALGVIVGGVVSSIGYAGFSDPVQQAVGGAIWVALLVFAAGWVALGLAFRAERAPHPHPTAA
jgi:hypothetical protein